MARTRNNTESATAAADTAAAPAAEAPAPKRRGRAPGTRTTRAAAGAAGDNAAATGEEGAAPTKQRRRRRRATGTENVAAEVGSVVESLLRSRGSRGASQEEMQSVVAWARSVRDEGSELAEIAKKPRRAKAQAPADRLARHEMNRALLEGILAGRIALDVQEGGSLVFLHGEHLAARNASVTGVSAAFTGGVAPEGEVASPENTPAG